MAIDLTKPADNGVIAQGPAEIRENIRALKEDQIVDAGKLGGKAASEFEAANPAIASHIASTANPHSTTAAQVGAVAKSGDTMSGDLNFAGAKHLFSTGSILLSCGLTPHICNNVKWNGSAYEKVNVAAVSTMLWIENKAIKIYYSDAGETNPLQYGPYTVFHSGNDGVGSGVNADTVDDFGVQSKTYHANGAGWIRIATANSGSTGISLNMGMFQLEFVGAGDHSSAIITAGISFGTNKSASLKVLANSQYNNGALKKARVVYHTTYTGNYAYIEVYVSTAGDLFVTMPEELRRRWLLIDPVAGSIPAGYLAQEIVFADQNQNHGFQKFGYTGSTAEWVCPPGVYKVWITAVGGGGGGGGASKPEGLSSLAGGGGGGGGAVLKREVAVSPGTSYTVTVGNGGTAGANTGGNGGTGGSTTFESEFTCSGGSGGSGTTSTTAGAGGSGGAGDIRGCYGGYGIYQTSQGAGGGSIFGGTSAFSKPYGSGSSTPNPPGSGGTGGFSASAASAGEIGCPGVLIIEW